MISEPQHHRSLSGCRIWQGRVQVSWLSSIVLLVVEVCMGHAGAAFEVQRCPACFRETDAVRYARVEALVIDLRSKDADVSSEDAADSDNQAVLTSYQVVLRLSEDGRAFSGPLKISGVAAADALPAQGTAGLLLLKHSGEERIPNAWTPACAFPEGFFPVTSTSGEVVVGPAKVATLPLDQAWPLLSTLSALRGGISPSWRTETASADPIEQIAWLWLSGAAPGDEATTLAREVLHSALTDRRAQWLSFEDDAADPLFPMLLQVAWPLLLPEHKAEMAVGLIAELDKHPALIAPQALQFLVQDGIIHVPDAKRRESLYHTLFQAHEIAVKEGGVITHRVFARFSEVNPWILRGGIRDVALDRVILDIARGSCCQDLLRDASDLMVLMPCLAGSNTPEGHQILRNIAETGTLPAGMIIQDSQTLQQVVDGARLWIRDGQRPESSAWKAVP